MLDERTRLAIALVLDGGPVTADLEAEAMRLGMCGAEIDAVRQGRSFDLRTSRAIALALADGDDGAAERARARAAGITEATCDAIEAWADERRKSRYPSP